MRRWIRACLASRQVVQVIELYESYRRTGFTQAFVEALEDFYRSIGVTAVHLLASNYTGSVVGGSFVFAHLGYDFDVQAGEGQTLAEARARRAAEVCDAARDRGAITEDEYASFAGRLWRPSEPR